MPTTIWDRYGGFTFVAKAVDDFYSRVLVAQELAPYFKNINMERLVEHQIETIGAVMGGPYELNVERLRVAHARFRIRPEHFDQVAVILSSTLKDNGLNTEDHDELMTVVASTRDVIVAP